MWYWKASHWLGSCRIFGPFPFCWLARLHRSLAWQPLAAGYSCSQPYRVLRPEKHR